MQERVKHLNPRQGITTLRCRGRPLRPVLAPGVKHLNPRQGITTSNLQPLPSTLRPAILCETPKSPPGDYNPVFLWVDFPLFPIICVKHLNPRQGITTGSHDRSRRHRHLHV